MSIAEPVTIKALAHRSLHRGADRWRAALTRRATDATESLSTCSLLVLAPHPDDETFGCGGLIARASATNTPVTVAVATDGRHSTQSGIISPDELARLRSVELDGAMAELGLPDASLLRLGWRDGDLTAAEPAVTEQIIHLIDSYQPDVVLAPCAQDEHPDHQALHRASVRAVAERGAELLCYPVWCWTHAPWFLDSAGMAHRARLWAWSMRQLASSDWLRVDCGEHLAAKRRAIARHVSQVSNLTGEPDWSYLTPEFVSLFETPVELLWAGARANP